MSARIDFGRSYRLARRIAQGDVAAIREREVLQRIGHDVFRARLAFLNRLGSDPLRRPLWLRRMLRERAA